MKTVTMHLCLLTLVGCMTVAVRAALQLTPICEFSSIDDGSVISMPVSYNAITQCSMGSVTFQTSQPALLTVQGGTVQAGGLMKVILGLNQFIFTLRSTEFKRDARLLIEGTPQSGGALSIQGSAFDVRSHRNGDTIAIDLRPILALPTFWSLTIYNNTFNIAAEQGSQQGLVAAVALTPSYAAQGYGDTSQVSFENCEVNLNVTGSAYGLYYIASEALETSVSASNNHIHRPSDLTGSANATAFLICFPLSSVDNRSALIRVTIQYNTVDRLGTFLQLTGSVVDTRVKSNTHSHHGPIVSNVTLALPVLGAFQFIHNAFRTVYEPWTLDSTLAGPIVIFWIQRASGPSGPNDIPPIIIAHNELHASRFVAIPFLFPGPTNFPENSSSLYLLDNYFTTSQLGDTSLSMSSFAISSASPARTSDLGTVFICSNTWPASFVAATTTTKLLETNPAELTTSTAPVTRTAVASADSLSVLVAAANRPRNVTLVGGDCPAFVETRRPNQVLRLPMEFAYAFLILVLLTI